MPELGSLKLWGREGGVNLLHSPQRQEQLKEKCCNLL